MRATQRHTSPDVIQSAKAHLNTWENLHFFVMFNKMRAGSPNPPPQKSDSEHCCCSHVERTQRSLSLYRRSDLQFTTNQTCQTVKFFFAQGFLRHFLHGTDTYEMKLAKQKPTFLDWTTHSMNHFVSMVLLSRQFLTGSMLQKSARIAREISSMRGQNNFIVWQKFESLANILQNKVSALEITCIIIYTSFLPLLNL